MSWHSRRVLFETFLIHRNQTKFNFRTRPVSFWSISWAMDTTSACTTLRRSSEESINKWYMSSKTMSLSHMEYSLRLSSVRTHSHISTISSHSSYIQITPVRRYLSARSHCHFSWPSSQRAMVAGASLLHHHYAKCHHEWQRQIVWTTDTDEKRSTSIILCMSTRCLRWFHAGSDSSNNSNKKSDKRTAHRPVRLDYSNMHRPRQSSFAQWSLS